MGDSDSTKGLDALIAPWIIIHQKKLPVITLIRPRLIPIDVAKITVQIAFARERRDGEIKAKVQHIGEPRQIAGWLLYTGLLAVLFMYRLMGWCPYMIYL